MSRELLELKHYKKLGNKELLLDKPLWRLKRKPKLRERLKEKQLKRELSKRELSKMLHMRLRDKIGKKLLMLLLNKEDKDKINSNKGDNKDKGEEEMVTMLIVRDKVK